MRTQDVQIFCSAAKDLGVYILVRDTNRDSLRHIGKPNCYPKPIDCKAKTADLGTRAGLVVSPELRSDAFTEQRRPKAEKAWREFAPALANAGRYKVMQDRGSPLHGCVTFAGRLLHGDYDLKAVITPGKHERRNFGIVEELHGVPHIRGYRVSDVMDYVNARIGIPMVQHGAAEQYGEHEDEKVLLFDVDGTTKALVGLPAIQEFYDGLSRPVLDGKQRYLSQPPKGPLPPNVIKFPGRQ